MLAGGVITLKASGRSQHNRKENMITQKMYNDYLDKMNDADWKNIRTKIEERYPETITWPEKMFRMYCSAVVRSGFRKEGLN